MIYEIHDLIELARTKSPYYKSLYADLPQRKLELSELPILDQAAFWKANQLENNQVLTAPSDDGVMYKSGGTTGSPKFSIFTRDEWRAFTQAFGHGMNQVGMKRGDRIANLFYAGELYASFLFITSSIEAAPEPALMLPIAGSTEHEHMAEMIIELKANTLAGVPTTILSLADYMLKHGLHAPSVKKILFGGEAMYGDQRHFLMRVFPGVEIRSIGYASVDAGLLGYADLTCEPGEHRCFGAETIIEIVDENTLETIHEINRPGKLLITNLTRGLMPIIRYPAGDRAVWCEDAQTANRKFLLLGRSEEGARIGPATLYYEDIAEVLQPYADELSIQGFQMVLDHCDRKDGLILRTAVADTDQAKLKTEAMIGHLLESRPMVNELFEQGLIHRPRIEWVGSSDLTVNPRTGKVRRVIDRRESSTVTPVA